MNGLCLDHGQSGSWLSADSWHEQAISHPIRIKDARQGGRRIHYIRLLLSVPPLSPWERIAGALAILRSLSVAVTLIAVWIQ